METRVKSEINSDSTKRNENLRSWNAGPNSICLRIELSDGTQFIVPYGYFEGVKYICEAETDVLLVQFKSHEFTVKGTALNELFTAFQSLSVEWMKECPRRYHALAKKEQAFIEKIEVKHEKANGA